MMNRIVTSFFVFVFLLSVQPAIAQDAEPYDEDLLVETEELLADEELDDVEPPEMPVEFLPTKEAFSKFDPRIVEFEYVPTDVFVITTKYGYQTSIQFDYNEEITAISVGDKSLWQIIPAGQRIFIRPMEEGVMTNMTVLTTQRAYQFDLKSLGPADKEGNIYAVSFYYPGEIARENQVSQAEIAAKAEREAKYALLSEEPKEPVATNYAPPDFPNDALPTDMPVVPEQAFVPAPAPGAAVAQPPAGTQYGTLPPPDSDVPFGGPTPPGGALVNVEPPPTVVRAQMTGENLPVASLPSPNPAPMPMQAAVPMETVVVDRMPDARPSAANFNYTYSGADILAPLQVFDDGRATYLKYASISSPLPDAYYLDASGQVVAADRSLSGEYLVVDKVVPEIILKSPQGSIHVFNESMAAAP